VAKSDEEECEDDEFHPPPAMIISPYRQTVDMFTAAHVKSAASMNLAPQMPGDSSRSNQAGPRARKRKEDEDTDDETEDIYLNFVRSLNQETSTKSITSMMGDKKQKARRDDNPRVRATSMGLGSADSAANQESFPLVGENTRSQVRRKSSGDSRDHESPDFTSYRDPKSQFDSHPNMENLNDGEMKPAANPVAAMAVQSEGEEEEKDDGLFYEDHEGDEFEEENDGESDEVARG
jgi:hypothetical protein